MRCSSDRDIGPPWSVVDRLFRQSPRRPVYRPTGLCRKTGAPDPRRRTPLCGRPAPHRSRRRPPGRFRYGVVGAVRSCTRAYGTPVPAS